jgi:hypothetical protein
MIDDYEQAMDLVYKMEAQRPIQVRPTAAMRHALRDQGSMVRLIKNCSLITCSMLVMRVVSCVV